MDSYFQGMSSCIYSRILRILHIFSTCLPKAPLPELYFPGLTLPPISLRMHGGGNFGESGNVASGDQTGKLSLGRLHVFLCGFQSVLEA